MREILFRGKDTDNGQWVYGDLVNAVDVLSAQKKTYIIWEAEYFSHGEFACVEEVIPETVGQYAGICDKNGNKIFEGDILGEQIWGDIRVLGVVKYGEGTFDSGVYEYTGFFYERPENGSHDHTNIAQSVLLEGYVEVIGNIIDNPELLEVQQ